MIIVVGLVWIFLNVLKMFTYLPVRNGVHIEQKWLEFVLTLMQACSNFRIFNFFMCLTLCELLLLVQIIISNDVCSLSHVNRVPLKPMNCKCKNIRSEAKPITC
jgi:hypothetical protein